MEFGAERDLEEAVDDLVVGEAPRLQRAAVGDLGVFGKRCRHQRSERHAAERQKTEPTERHECRALIGAPRGAHHGHRSQAVQSPLPFGRQNSHQLALTAHRHPMWPPLPLPA